MANDETIAALERAADVLETQQPNSTNREKDDAARIRAHIETLRNGDERAQIVAWLRSFCTDMTDALADAIEAGAHLK